MIHSKTIWVLLLVCLFSRLIFFLAVKPWNPVVRDKIILQGDALEYHQLATTMIQFHQFSYEKDGPPDAMRTPLYPVFVGLIYMLQNQFRPWSVLLVQILIDTASCILLFSLLSKFLIRRATFYASLFYALDPFLILYSATLLSDILFVFLCVLGTYLLAVVLSQEFDRDSKLWVALSAFSFGLATLVRPVAQFMPIVVSLFLLIFLRKRLKRALGLIVLFSLFFMLTLSPWLIRNLIHFNTFSLSVVGNYDLTILYVQPMEVERRGQPYDMVRKALLEEADQLMIRDGLDPKKVNDFQKGKYWKRLAFHYIAQNPLSFLKHYLFGIFHTMGNLATGTYAEMLQLPQNTSKFQIKGHPDLVGLIKTWLIQKSRGEIGIGMTVALYLLITYSLGLVGLIVFWREYRYQKYLWFSFLMVVYFIFITGSAGLARYKLPAVPFYLAFVGIGLSYVFRKKIVRQERR